MSLANWSDILEICSAIPMNEKLQGKKRRKITLSQFTRWHKHFPPVDEPSSHHEAVVLK